MDRLRSVVSASFYAYVREADSFHALHLVVVGFNASSHRDMSHGSKYFEQVTCRSDDTLNLALEKPSEDVRNLLGMPPSCGSSIKMSIAAFRRSPSIGPSREKNSSRRWIE